VSKGLASAATTSTATRMMINRTMCLGMVAFQVTG
jgi:hypothetical protein